MKISSLYSSNRCGDCTVRCDSAFKDLTISHAGLIDNIRQLKTLKQGQKTSFIHEGRVGFYCIQSGHIKLDYGSASKPGTLRICGPGDLIGYMMAHNYTVEALEDSKLCFVGADAFSELQKKRPEFSMGIIQSLIKIISIKDERIVGLENHSVKNRIASTLLSLLKKFGITSAHGRLINTKIDRRTLANLSGTVVESLARALTELEQSKVIFRQGRRIHIVDEKKLSRIAKS